MSTRTGSLLGLSAFLFSAIVPVQAASEAASDGTGDGSRMIISGFIPKIWPAVIFTVLYLLSGTLHWIHWFRTGRPRYMLTLTISMYTMAIGFIFRIIYTQGDNIYSIPWYSLQSIFTLLSPCAFLAVDYVLLRKLAESLGEETAKDCLFVKSSIIVKLFVWSDVITFLVQASGAGMEVNADMSELGSNIAMAGLIIQILSFIFFTILLIRFGWRARTAHPHIWKIGAGESIWADFGFFKITPFHDWRILWSVMCLTSVAIIIRCIFRIVEFKGGYRGYVMMHEGFFYLLDSLPLWLAMSLYAWLWPTRLSPVARNNSMPYVMQPLNDDGKGAAIHSSRSVV
ncbi:RTA1 like protein-domain-containing protein [Schizophyllum fasciatum]